MAEKGPGSRVPTSASLFGCAGQDGALSASEFAIGAATGAGPQIVLRRSATTPTAPAPAERPSSRRWAGRRRLAPRTSTSS